jgi:hypothetical protein
MLREMICSPSTISRFRATKKNITHGPPSSRYSALVLPLSAPGEQIASQDWLFSPNRVKSEKLHGDFRVMILIKNILHLVSSKIDRSLLDYF